jgi:hypothetical protein
MVAAKAGTMVGVGADVGIGLQAQHSNKHPNSNKVLMRHIITSCYTVLGCSMANRTVPGC